MSKISSMVYQPNNKEQVKLNIGTKVLTQEKGFGIIKTKFRARIKIFTVKLLKSKDSQKKMNLYWLILKESRGT